MNKTILYGIGISTIAIAGLATIPSFVNAESGITKNGSGYQQMLQTKADLMGLSKEDLAKKLETKTFEQIAEEQNISEDQIHAAMQKAAEKRWSEKGLTKEEIAERLTKMQERQAGDHEQNSVNRSQRQSENRLNRQN